MSNEFALRQYTLPLPQPFETSKSLQDFGTPKPGSHHDESWPVLYILTNSKNKTAYIGQTTNYRRRMKQHAANVDKDFDRTLLIDNPTFNQSATFEFENRLIELFCADEKYQVTNANNGYAQFEYLSDLSIARSSETSGRSFAKRTMRSTPSKSSRTLTCSNSRPLKRSRPINTKRLRRFTGGSSKSMKTLNTAVPRKSA